jgi:hypothetical protein
MFIKEAFKITALITFLFLTSLVSTPNKAYAAINLDGNCKEVNGRYYISNEYYRICSIFANPTDCRGIVNLTSYSSNDQCNSASIEKYGCSPALNTYVLYGYPTDAPGDLKFVNRVVVPNDAAVCLKTIADGKPALPEQPYCKADVKFFQCKCSKTLVGEAGVFGDVISWISGLDTFSCYLTELRAPKLVTLPPVNVYSPLDFFKTSANLFFALAVFIFLLNLINVGTKYIQSEGRPDDIKKASELLSNTIKGMVFFLLVIGLIGYLLDAFRL